MKILIIEDDLNKRQQLKALAESGVVTADVREESSYRGGVKALVDWKPDIVLLDMTLPTYDVTTTDSGGRTRIFGGRDVLTEMKRRSIVSKVVLVTQFENFGEADKRVTLPELSRELSLAFPGLFVDAVYYHASRADWKSQIETLLIELCRDHT